MPKPINKTKLKQKLQKLLGRTPLAHEEINAEKDVGILLELLIERVDDLEDRVDNLENNP